MADQSAHRVADADIPQPHRAIGRAGCQVVAVGVEADHRHIVEVAHQQAQGMHSVSRPQPSGPVADAQRGEESQRKGQRSACRGCAVLGVCGVCVCGV